MQGKVILITGDAKRMGAAICRKLHAPDANLIVPYRSSLEAAQRLQTELKHSVVLVQADLLEIERLPV